MKSKNYIWDLYCGNAIRNDLQHVFIIKLLLMSQEHTLNSGLFKCIFRGCFIQNLPQFLRSQLWYNAAEKTQCLPSLHLYRSKTYGHTSMAVMMKMLSAKMNISESNLLVLTKISSILEFYLEENKANIIKHTDFLYSTISVSIFLHQNFNSPGKIF